MSLEFTEIDTPFEYRNCCWFCNEPSARLFSFPQSNNHLISCIHPPLSLHCCKECYIPASKSQGTSIWAVFKAVKRNIIKKYQKDLAIGINWTEEELANSQFDGGNFEGFKRSAWFMYEVAKNRVNFTGWALIVGGINIEELRWDKADDFIFDGVVYPSINEAIEQYSIAFALDENYLQEVVALIGVNKFAYAVRFCRLLVGTTPTEKKQALKELV
jgi:hypothetical protein